MFFKCLQLQQTRKQTHYFLGISRILQLHMFKRTSMFVVYHQSTSTIYKTGISHTFCITEIQQQLKLLKILW